MPFGQPVQRFDFQSPFPHELYLPKKKGPFPLIFVTPMLGRFLILEDLFFERQFARFFAESGFASALIARPIFEFNPARGLEQVSEYLDESVTRNRVLLDTLVKHEAVDPGKIGTYGVSFGAIVNSLWAAEDTRPKAHLFALGGGNLPAIMLSCRDPLMRSYLKAMEENTGLKGKLLLENLKKLFRRDPLEAAHKISKENVCLHLALFDRVIRPRYSFAFRKALGNPETIFIPLGHYSSILSVPILRHQAVRFFRSRLDGRV
jgi:hypothetical protein